MVRSLGRTLVAAVLVAVACQDANMDLFPPPPPRGEAGTGDESGTGDTPMGDGGSAGRGGSAGYGGTGRGGSAGTGGFGAVGGCGPGTNCPPPCQPGTPNCDTPCFRSPECAP